MVFAQPLRNAGVSAERGTHGHDAPLLLGLLLVVLHAQAGDKLLRIVKVLNLLAVLAHHVPVMERRGEIEDSKRGEYEKRKTRGSAALWRAVVHHNTRVCANYAHGQLADGLALAVAVGAVPRRALRVWVLQTNQRRLGYGDVQSGWLVSARTSQEKTKITGPGPRPPYHGVVKGPASD